MAEEVELPNTEELEEIRGKTFTKRVALTTAIFAVMLAITSLGGNNAMKEMLLSSSSPLTNGLSTRPKSYASISIGARNCAWR